jgi:glycosyltransferase involved in cell wall biosynthesis
MLAAVTSNLLLGGANTFLLNLLRASRGEPLRIISTGALNEHATDFAALKADVRTAALQGLIYEDRLAWAYGELAAVSPRAVLASLGSESFEMLRLAPPSVARIGLVQADDAAVYAMAAQYADSLDAIVGVSAQICERLRADPRFAGVRVAAIPYGIAFEPPSPRPERPAHEPLRVLYLGRLIEEQKRISRIVELVQRLEKAGARVHFTIAGNGRDEATVRGALAASRIVDLRGPIANREVPALLREHDVYVLLSDFEGLPLSLLEAMGEGLVPVVSDLPSGLAEVVTAETGLRVPVGDVAAAEAAILGLAGDRPRLHRLSENAARLARSRYSAERMVSEYLALIDSIAPRETPLWPPAVQIPAPRGLRPWLYRGWPRSLRRVLKRLAYAGAKP